MTNAGNHTWGIEFDPIALVEKISSDMVFQIAYQEKELQERDIPKYVNPKSIGIITGNGPGSGISLWQKINSNICDILQERFLGDISYPEIRIVSLPAMGLSMELDKRYDITRDTLLSAVETLKNENVEILALACHTTSYFQKEIKEIFNTNSQTFIPMPESVLRYLKREKIYDLAILGISYVAELAEWSAYTPLKAFNIEKLDNKTMKKSHELSYNLKKGLDYHKNFLKLINLFKNNINSQNLLIASTELSILLENSIDKNKRSKW